MCGKQNSLVKPVENALEIKTTRKVGSLFIWQNLELICENLWF